MPKGSLANTESAAATAGKKKGAADPFDDLFAPKKPAAAGAGAGAAKTAQSKGGGLGGEDPFADLFKK